MLHKSLAEAYLKLNRANHHIKDFDTQVAAFFESGAYSITIEPDPNTGEESVKVSAAQATPEALALVMGDAIHNLRSALDIAWFGIVSADSAKPERECFPMHWNRENLVSFIKGRSEHKSVSILANVLLDVIQPYKGGNGDVLYALHKLDVRDKHQLLIPQVQILTLDGLWVSDDKGERYGIKARTFSNKRPLRLSHGGSRNLKVVKEGYCSGTIVFGKGTPVAGRLVLPTLRKFEVAVTSTLITLESFFGMGESGHPNIMNIV